MKKLWVICLAGVIALAVAGCGGGGGSESGTINIVGTWTGTVDSDSSTFIVTNQSGSTFSGTLDGDSITGTISGSSSSFTYTLTDGTDKVTGTGSISGNTMSGTYKNGGYSGTFSFTKKTSSPSPSGGVVYSSDYFGLEVGFQLTYSCSEYDSGSTITKNGMSNVMSVTSPSSGIYVYKMAQAYDGETLGSSGSGEYAEKSGASYYYYGYWDGTKNYLETTPSLMVTNPITAAFTSPEWGTNNGQVSVTVPAGTFTAWLFESTDTDSGVTTNVKFWFVPYLGFVKRVETETTSGTTTYSETKELSSSAKGVTITSSTVGSMQVKNQSNTKRKGWFH